MKPVSNTGLTTAPEQPPLQKLVVFDSGVGGLSICREIIATLAAAQTHFQLQYLSDNAAFPYGKKTADELIARVTALLSQAYEQWQPDIIVIACNTASTVVLPHLRERLPIPIVGVVPAIKLAAQLTDKPCFGLLATPGTVERDYTKQLIQNYAAQHRVISVGSSELVEAIEAFLYGASLDLARINTMLQAFDSAERDNALDTIVLGCTHFPLIEEQLHQLKPNIRWINSGPAIAARVQHLLNGSPPAHFGDAAQHAAQHKVTPSAQNHSIAATQTNPTHRAWFTLPPKKSEGLNSFLSAQQFDSARYFDVKD